MALTPMSVGVVLALVLGVLCMASAAETPVTSVRIAVANDPKGALRHIGDVLGRQITQRCNAKVSPDAAQQTVELAIEPGIGADGFAIKDGPNGTIRICGDNERGVLYGAGKFLRTSRYLQTGFVPSAWRGSSVPKCPVRAIYLATHFSNFYEAAPIEDVRQYIEELGLWGYNTVLVHFPTWQFNGLNDPAARKWLDRVKLMVSDARQCGLQFGLLQCSNQGYKTSSSELKGQKVPGNFRGNFGINLCPSKPEARKVLVQLYDELFEEFKDAGLEYVCFWPYDEGGCSCPDCWPWGARGYVSLSKELAQHYRARFPSGKVILSTWCYENENDADPDGEWAGLAKALTEDKRWVDAIMADGHNDYFPGYLLKTGVPGGVPLLNFPEISMFGMCPWGGYGTNPAPAHFQMLWDRIKLKAAGGAPYSEGIYEDLNKAVCAQFYWDPERKAEDSVKEYAAYEFAPDAADDLLAVTKIFEQNHDRQRIQPNAVRAFELVSEAEKQMTEQTRKSWRWRIFFLRALVDKELFERKGKLEGEALKSAFEELTRIYHAQNAGPMPLKPPQVAK